MTREEKTLLIAVAEGFAKLTEERFESRFKGENPTEALRPFRELIEAVKNQKG